MLIMGAPRTRGRRFRGLAGPAEIYYLYLCNFMYKKLYRLKNKVRRRSAMRVKQVAAAIIRDGNRIFATQRGHGEFRGYWEFPGGKLEAGETPRQAAVREVAEELGVDVKLGELAVSYTHLELAEQLFSSYLMKTISIRDTFTQKSRKENFYHGVLLGLLSSEDDWIVTSNAESGKGYSDILAEIEEERLGIVIELKYSESGAAGDMDAQCQKALHQIREKKYGQKLLSDGMRTVLAYGIACNKKQCRVAMEMLQGSVK